MPPVGAAGVAAETFGQPLSRPCAVRLVKRFAMFELGLQIPRRGFHHRSWLEAFRLHSCERVSLEVIHQAEPMHACRPHIDVAAIKIFAP
jgi:hypothetical protein